MDFANAAPPTTATSRKDEERDCCRFVALNLDLLHGERSPPVEARPPLSFAPGQGKEGVAYSLAWLDCDSPHQ